MRPTKNQIQKWVLALRSGEYSQTTGKLQDDCGHCCLGVACDVFIPKKLQFRNNAGYLIGAVPNTQDRAEPWLRGMTTILGAVIPALNDCGSVIPADINEREKFERFTFDEIADLLEYEYIYEVLS